MIRKSVQRLDPYVPGEQPEGGGVIKLNTNENPYPPSPKVLRALKDLDGARLRLYPDPRSTALRRRIASLHHCGLSNVFAGNGSDEILTLCVRAFVENNGSLGYFYPSYSLYPVLAGIRGLKTCPVNLGNDFEWRMPASYRTSVFLMTNPNAPTGIRYPREEVERFCRRFQGVVVIDEAYVDFADEDCARLALEREKVF